MIGPRVFRTIIFGFPIGDLDYGVGVGYTYTYTYASVFGCRQLW